MKWLPPSGSTQGTVDGRYVIVRATDTNWIAYDITLSTAAKELGVRESDLKARAVCEAEEARLMASMRRRA